MGVGWQVESDHGQRHRTIVRTLIRYRERTDLLTGLWWFFNILKSDHAGDISPFTRSDAHVVMSLMTKETKETKEFIY